MTSRRAILSSFLGTAVAAAYPCWIEPRWLALSRVRVTLARRPLVRPIRILHLADLHASLVVPLSMIADAIMLGVAQKPDLICVTGDFISHRDAPPAAEYARTLRRLSDAAPTFAVLGNHDGGSWSAGRGGFPDHWLMERILANSGIQLLHNRPTRVEVRGTGIVLAGVGDWWSDEIDAGRAFDGVGGETPVVVLSHNPDSKAVLKRHTWDLMLSGHTHGGQIIVPLYGAPFHPVEDMRYLAGLKPWGTRQIHVTRGVGNLLGIRFACRPEVSLLELA